MANRKLSRAESTNNPRCRSNARHRQSVARCGSKVQSLARPSCTLKGVPTESAAREDCKAVVCATSIYAVQRAVGYLTSKTSRPPEVEAERSRTCPKTLSLFSTDLRQWLNTEEMPCRQGHRLCYTTNDHKAMKPMMSQVGALMQISPEYAAASNPRNGSQTEHECPTVLRKWHFNQE